MLRKPFVSITLFLLFASSVRATHISGGEIYYDCLGGDQYRITLVVYRDCIGVDLDNSYQLNVTSPCGNKTMTVSTTGGTEISQLCASELSSSTCNGGSFPGIQQYLYTGTVNLPACDSWTISWTEPYRNAAIANLVNPGNKNVYIQAKLNNVAGPCDDSPQFSNTAIPYVCATFPITYSYGAFDPEGDSLTYTFISAMNTGAVALPYQATFSGLQPITGITLDPQTGEVNFTLNSIGNWVVVVRVDEYDANGIWIGSVMRDMQFVAYPCTNVPPDPDSGTVTDLTGASTQLGPRSVEICESGTFCFDAVMTDVNATDILTATSNIAQNLPGATFSYTGTNPITCHVCWTGLPGASGFFPFIVSVNDGACPIPAIQTYIFSIHVLPGISLIGPTIVNEGCFGDGDGSATVSVDVGLAPFTYAWSTGDDTPGIIAGSGDYQVVVSDANGCVSAPLIATIGADGHANVAHAGSDLIGCFASLPVQLQGTVTNATGGSWSGGSGIFFGSGLNVTYMPTAAEIAANSVDLLLTTTGNTTCPSDQDSVHITLPTSFFNAAADPHAVLCAGDPTGSASFTPPDPSYTYQWDDPNAQTTPVAVDLLTGTYSLFVTDQFGCDTTYSVIVPEPPLLIISSAGASDPTCPGYSDGMALTTTTGGTPGYSYQWSANAGGQSTAIAGDLPSGAFTATVTDANGCQAQLTTILTAPPPILLSAQLEDTVCVNSVVDLTAQATGGSGGYTFNWGGIGTGDTLQYSFSASQTVSVTVSDQAGCSGPVLQLPVTVLDLSTAVLLTYGDTTVCPGGSAIVSAFLSDYSGAYTIQWPQIAEVGNGPFTLPNVSDQLLDVMVTDVCGNMLHNSVSIDVQTPPMIELPPLIAEGCAPLTVHFPSGLSNADISYLWDLGDGTTSTAMAPVHVYTAGHYVVSLTVTTAIGCTADALNTGSVNAYASPVAEFSADPWETDADHADIAFTDLTQGEVLTWTWSFGDDAMGEDQDPTHQYAAPGTYPVTLEVTDPHGCFSSITHPVLIDPVYDVTVPNAFTPNPNGGNGGSFDPMDLSNDVFYPFIRFVKDFRMRVYDRWGELIFESNAIDQGWDGYYLGQLSPQDVYAYQLWVRFVDGKEVQQLGNITLFR